MKIRNRIVCIMMVCFMAGALVLTGCKSNVDGDKISIVATIFPEYDWVKQIIGENSDNIELTLLLDSGVDLHNYQPTAEDIIKVSTCDMFIYVGGHSDSWVDDVLAQSKNKNMVIINLMEVLGDSVKNEEVVEGMEHAHSHEEEETGHEHVHHETDEEHNHNHEEEEHVSEDEHVWLSLNNAKLICERIGEEIVKLDAQNKDKYDKNVVDYCNKLQALNVQYEEAVNAATTRTLLFADRFPFRYLVDDYDVDYYAAFSGCSAESEASFETITFLAGKIDELGLSSVVVLEGTDKGIAGTVINASGQKNVEVITMDSMQSVTYEDVKNGATYISIMESNLEAIKNALN